MKHSALHIKQILITAISAIAISSSAYAVQPTTLTSNGVPFQALQTQIDNNADLIGENTAALTLLNTEISNINTQINNVDNALADLSLRVHDNTADINSAFGRIANNEDSVATLNDLVATHKIDVLSLQNALKQINVDILEINEQRQDFTATLNTRLAAINASIDSNALALDSMLVDLVMINSQLSSANSTILSLTLQHGQFQEQFDTLVAQIANLSAAIEALKAGGGGDTTPDNPDTPDNPTPINTCIANITLGIPEAGVLEENSGCLSDSKRHSYAQYYQFTITAITSVVIDLEGIAPDVLSDPLLFLHTGSRTGAILDYNDDANGGTLDSQISITLNPGLYTLEATSLSPEEGTFRIIVQ